MKTSKIKSKPKNTAGKPPSGSLHSACSVFVDAWNALEAAETALCDAARPHLEACKTIDDYYELIEKLPRRYRGVRRIYEVIERMADKQNVQENPTP
jgi:hypothetical protein